MHIRKILAVAAITTLAATTAQANIIFTDTFDTTGGSILNWNGGANWTVQNGTVDLVRSGEFSIDCLGNTGHCVDMDGSSGQAGEILSRNLGPLAAGNYEFSYWLSGNQRVASQLDIVVALSLGGGGILSSAVHTFLGSDGWQQYTQTFTLTSVTDPVLLDFSGLFGDNIGAVLDNVELRSVPEPGTLGLLGLGLAAVGLSRRRRVRPIS